MVIMKRLNLRQLQRKVIFKCQIREKHLVDRGHDYMESEVGVDVTVVYSLPV